MPSHLARFALCLAFACGGGETLAPATESPDEEAPPEPEAPEPEPEGSEPEAAEPEPEAPEPEDSEPDPSEGEDVRADPALLPNQLCESTDDCGWDAACAPRRCVAAEHAESPDRECFGTAPPPGECLCVQGRCTLRREEPPEPASGCRAARCNLDASAGRCVTETTGTRGSVVEGPLCTCDWASDECRFEWREPVSCRSAQDCWIDERGLPIRRPRRFRGREFRPCEDGEAPPDCRGGYCTVSTVAYGC